MSPGPREILLFEVDRQHYGLPAAVVREIVRAVTVVPLPGAPPAVEGVINLRGRVVPVLDLRARFRLPAKPVEPADHFLVAWAGERLVALRVDRAVDLVRLDPVDVQDAREVEPGVEHVAWVAKCPEKLVLIHDLTTFLSRPEAVALADALPSGSSPTTEEGGRVLDPSCP